MKLSHRSVLKKMSASKYVRIISMDSQDKSEWCLN